MLMFDVLNKIMLIMSAANPANEAVGDNESKELFESFRVFCNRKSVSSRENLWYLRIFSSTNTKIVDLCLFPTDTMQRSVVGGHGCI